MHFIVGFAASGGTDVMARLIAQKLSEKWGQPVVVENRTGADGSIAADFVAHSPPDGYNIAWISNAHTVTPLEFKLNYEPVKSFAPVTLAANVPEFLLINPALPVKTMREFVAYAKANPGKLSFGASGTAGADYLEVQFLMNQAGIKMVGVPYKGGAPAMTAVIGGEIQLMMGTVTAIESIKAGKLKALFVTGTKRLQQLPDVPTVGEAIDLPEFDKGTRSGTWFGALAPAGTPSDIVHSMRNDIAAVLKLPEVVDVLSKRGFMPNGDTPEEFTRTISDDITMWASVKKSMDAEK